MTAMTAMGVGEEEAGAGVVDDGNVADNGLTNMIVDDENVEDNGVTDMIVRTIETVATSYASSRRSGGQRSISPNSFLQGQRIVASKLLEGSHRLEGRRERCSRCWMPLMVVNREDDEDASSRGQDGDATCVVCNQAEDFERKLVDFSGMHASGVAGEGIDGGVGEHEVEDEDEDDERREEILVSGDELEIVIRETDSWEPQVEKEEDLLGLGDNEDEGSDPHPDPVLEDVRINVKTTSSTMGASEGAPRNDNDNVEVAVRRRCPLCAMDLADHPFYETECPFCPVAKLDVGASSSTQENDSTSKQNKDTEFSLDDKKDGSEGIGNKFTSDSSLPEQHYVAASASTLESDSTPKHEKEDLDRSSISLHGQEVLLAAEEDDEDDMLEGKALVTNETEGTEADSTAEEGPDSAGQGEEDAAGEAPVVADSAEESAASRSEAEDDPAAFVEQNTRVSTEHGKFGEEDGGDAEEKTAASSEAEGGASAAESLLRGTAASRPPSNDELDLAMRKEDEALFHGQCLEPASLSVEQRAFEKESGGHQVGASAETVDEPIQLIDKYATPKDDKTALALYIAEHSEEASLSVPPNDDTATSRPTSGNQLVSSPMLEAGYLLGRARADRLLGQSRLERQAKMGGDRDRISDTAERMEGLLQSNQTARVTEAKTVGAEVEKAFAVDPPQDDTAASRPTLGSEIERNVLEQRATAADHAMDGQSKESESTPPSEAHVFGSYEASTALVPILENDVDGAAAMRHNDDRPSTGSVQEGTVVAASRGDDSSPSAAKSVPAPNDRNEAVRRLIARFWRRNREEERRLLARRAFQDLHDKKRGLRSDGTSRSMSAKEARSLGGEESAALEEGTIPEVAAPKQEVIALPDASESSRRDLPTGFDGIVTGHPAQRLAEEPTGGSGPKTVPGKEEIAAAPKGIAVVQTTSGFSSGLDTPSGLRLPLDFNEIVVAPLSPSQRSKVISCLGPGLDPDIDPVPNDQEINTIPEEIAAVRTAPSFGSGLDPPSAKDPPPMVIKSAVRAKEEFQGSFGGIDPPAADLLEAEGGAAALRDAKSNNEEFSFAEVAEALRDTKLKSEEFSFSKIDRIPVTNVMAKDAPSAPALEARNDDNVSVLTFGSDQEDPVSARRDDPPAPRPDAAAPIDRPANKDDREVLDREDPPSFGDPPPDVVTNGGSGSRGGEGRVQANLPRWWTSPPKWHLGSPLSHPSRRQGAPRLSASKFGTMDKEDVRNQLMQLEHQFSRMENETPPSPDEEDVRNQLTRLEHQFSRMEDGTPPLPERVPERWHSPVQLERSASGPSEGWGGSRPSRLPSPRSWSSGGVPVGGPAYGRGLATISEGAAYAPARRMPKWNKVEGTGAGPNIPPNKQEKMLGEGEEGKTRVGNETKGSTPGPSDGRGGGGLPSPPPSSRSRSVVAVGGPAYGGGFVTISEGTAYAPARRDVGVARPHREDGGNTGQRKATPLSPAAVARRRRYKEALVAKNKLLAMPSFSSDLVSIE